jgi:hypothetical protein
MNPERRYRKGMGQVLGGREEVGGLKKCKSKPALFANFAKNAAPIRFRLALIANRYGWAGTPSVEFRTGP